jgi:glucose dehydrogenase
VTPKPFEIPRAIFIYADDQSSIGPISVSAAQTVLGYLRDDDPNNWPTYNRSFDGSRCRPLKEITKDNVKNLRVA